ncbi:hypothetical protein F5I97DRAFT_1940745 [Phlebopus sp. FC_14]|nr:hypothetical protein F5I97DRAFT_1940745 [Phlebopus sp. FC_14]
MSAWYSWFSGIPAFDFAVPSGIQRRFFSFVLKRYLGSFLKPGQLDLHQIDSQLGSGTVQVKDLELDSRAINELLVGLPVRLHDGFISGVTARIPLPNPLTASVGLHVQSLNLTLHVTDERQTTAPTSPFHDTSHLADSVASVAQTFIHHELTPREEATLRGTLKPTTVPPLHEQEHNLPGGFDPFVYDGGTQGGPQGEEDPAGVSVFATLIERLLARFEFTALDTKVTIVHPGRCSLIFTVSEVAYRTEIDESERLEIHVDGNPCSEEIEREKNEFHARTISIAGFSVFLRDLRSVICSPTTTTGIPSPVSGGSSQTRYDASAKPMSRSSSSSSLDEDTQLLMSQSIAILPPRSPSPTNSVFSSIYHSAISTSQAPSQAPSGLLAQRRVPAPLQIFTPRANASMEETNDDNILSFGSQPLSIRLRTPSRSRTHGQDGQANEPSSEDADSASVAKPAEKEVFQLSVTMGAIACALRARQIRMLLDLVDVCGSNFSTRPSVPHRGDSPSTSLVALGLQADVTVRALVLLVFMEPEKGESCSLNAYFEHPLIPPRLPYTYVRLILDSLAGSMKVFGLSIASTHTSPFFQESPPASATVVLSDLSLFAFHAVSSVDDPHIAAPILITDHHLPTLYTAHPHRPSLTSERPADVRLPIFDVLDWTNVKYNGNSAKLSTWRSKYRASKGDKGRSPAQLLHKLPSSSPNPFMASLLSDAEERPTLPPAIEVAGQVTKKSPSKAISRSLDVKIAPLHIFLDLGMILNSNVFASFIEEVMSARMFTSQGDTPRFSKAEESFESSDQDLADLSEDDYGSEDSRFRRVSQQAQARELERKRLERLVLEDLDLDLDYGTKGTTRSKVERRQPSRKKKTKGPKIPSLEIVLACSMVRVEVRCIPPKHLPPRSGCLLLDLRGLVITNSAVSPKPALRFSEGPETPLRSSAKIPSKGFLIAKLQEILVAYSPVDEVQAHTLLILGCLPAQENEPNASALLATEPSSETLPLCLVFGKSSLPKRTDGGPSSRLLLTVDIPLVNLVLEKGVFDGLQYWADDVAQLVELSLTARDNATETLPSHSPSLIGSRFFAKSRRVGSRSSEESNTDSSGHQVNVSNSEIVVKVTVTEALIRIAVPREGDDSYRMRPFDISVSDVDALVEFKPDGKEETVITAGIMDLRIVDTLGNGNYMPLLVLSAPRSLSSTPRPMIKARVTSLVVPETTAKESRIKLSCWGFTCHVPQDVAFASDLVQFAKAPPGVFESVVPSELTRLSITVVDVSIHSEAPKYPGAAVLHIGGADLTTELVGNSSISEFRLGVSSSHFFIVDSIHDTNESLETFQGPVGQGVGMWKNSGYALVAEVADLDMVFQSDSSAENSHTDVVIDHTQLQIHLCADTITAIAGFTSCLTSTSKEDTGEQPPRGSLKVPSTLSAQGGTYMTASVDDQAFKRIPEPGSTADMITDDLPANPDYLDASFGAAAGLRELTDQDLDDFDTEEQGGRGIPLAGETGIVSKVGGETIRILQPLSFVEHYFDTLPPDAAGEADNVAETALRVRIHNSDIVLCLHDGFDWPRTRKIIEKEVKEMRKKLARIRQLVATGQTQEPIEEETSATLFNSLHIGLEQDLDNMDPDTLLAAIDNELDDTAETGTQSSWQTLHPASPGRSPGQPAPPSSRLHGKRLKRSKGPSIEIRLSGLDAEVDRYRPGETLISRTLILVKDLEILDHIKTSTWKKFLTSLQSDSRGNIRETDSSMARVELLSVRPSPSHPAEEARLRAKILPLRLYVDQDALDFFKKFFAFKDPDSPAVTEESDSKEATYFQHAEVFPVDIKLDYKPRRVDYRALREGRTIELMNFFHFDGAEMTLRHLTLHGITGWPRFFDTLNDLWTPDVKATQLVDVISGVSPIRSMVNVGSGVADLVLLPIAQYKKDGRIVRGVQKGTRAFVQSTAMEAIKLGARLATGTQVILEQAESVLGAQDSITAETLQIPYEYEEDSDEDVISRYAGQPAGITEGVQSAYRSLQRNLHSAAQTILAVPMEVYERSGNEGPVRAVVRAVPIAVLKPMIGASEAVGKTLMGLHNTLDPNIRHENQAKYKRRS